MLNYTKAFSSFSVNDLDAAMAFYKDILGIQVSKEEMGNIALHIKGNENIMVYPKPDHTPATFTVLNFLVPDLEKTVDDLAAKGIKFEHYDNQYIKTDNKGIARGNGGPSIAWFKDPAGNFISVIEDK